MDETGHQIDLLFDPPARAGRSPTPPVPPPRPLVGSRSTGVAGRRSRRSIRSGGPRPRSATSSAAPGPWWSQAGPSSTSASITSAWSLTETQLVYELVQRLGLTSPQHLALSHLRLVLGIPEKHQARLLDKAERDGWSITRLETEAQKYRREGRGGGRPSIPTALKALRGWSRATAIEDFTVRLGDVEMMKPAEREEARLTVAEMQRQLAALAARLGRADGAGDGAQALGAQAVVHRAPGISVKGRR